MNPVTTKRAPTRRPSRQRRDAPSLEETRLAQIDHALDCAVVAALLVDPIGWNALIEQLTDEQLGRMFKNRLWRSIGVSTILDIDLPSTSDEGEKLRKRVSRKSKLRASESSYEFQSGSTQSERHNLVQKGKLLRLEDYLGAANVTMKQYCKARDSGRVFNVELEGKAYIPGFFLSPLIYQNDFGKVIRGLGKASGWDRWDFFTTPTEKLAGSTPLQFLAINKLKPVLEAAEEFAKR